MIRCRLRLAPGLLLLCGWLLVAAGCAPATASPAPVSAWGTVITLAERHQPEAPAIWPAAGRIATAWMGAGEPGFFAQVVSVNPAAGDRINEPQSLPLPVVHPHTYRLVPAARDHLAWLWLDDVRDETEQGLRLWSALLAPDLSLERGSVRISTLETYRYAAAANADGSLWVVWSGGLRAEPALYAQHLDGAGRPRFPERLIADADWPVLIDTRAGQRALLWLGASDGRVYRALPDAEGTALQNIAALTTAPRLETGDRLADFRAGTAAGHVYLFWNIVRASGQAETWLAHGPLNADDWDAPTRLGIIWLPDSRFETGFNGGAGLLAAAGETPVAWAAPLAGDFDALAVAAQVGDALGIIYFSGGRVAGYQQVIAPEVSLLAAPRLQTDRDRHLYLSWSQLNPDGPAFLRLTSTR
jgi:hypothetical protein